MTIKLDNRPLYLQVIDRLKRDINEGAYKEREKLPSEFNLAKQLGVSRATLREALRILEEENVVIRRHGVGTFVHSKPLFTSGIEQLNSVTQMILTAGMTPGTIFLNSHISKATEEEMKKFQCEQNSEILTIERVRTANGEPVVYCVDKVLSSMFSMETLLQNESIFNQLEKYSKKKITSAVAQIIPIGYHDKISPILNCNSKTALLMLQQMHYSELDEPILYSVNYFRADQFSFHVLRKRF